MAIIKNPGFTMFQTHVSPAYLVDIRRKFYFVDYQSPAYYSHLSRYKNLRTIKNEDNRIVHETMFNYMITEREQETKYTVTSRSANRLDIISLIHYNNAHLWWIIAIANNIIDPFDVPEGLTLRIPDLMSLYETGSMFG